MANAVVPYAHDPYSSYSSYGYSGWNNYSNYPASQSQYYYNNGQTPYSRYGYNSQNSYPAYSSYGAGHQYGQQASYGHHSAGYQQATSHHAPQVNYAHHAAPAPSPAGYGRRRLYFTATSGRSLPRGPSPGEDSFFISNSGVSLGIADGVGQWKSHGIDAGQYSRGLMAHSNAYVTDAVLHGRTDQLNPLAILTYAYLANQQNNVVGTSTALVAILDAEGVMRIVNVGDSVCMVFRGGQMVYRTQEQQHSFNCPFQLGTSSYDKPGNGEHHAFPLAEGDIVAMCSDGVSDNLFDQDLVRAVNSSHDTAVIATAIVTAAKHASTHRSAPTPFAAAASRAGHPYQGGKADDITVVVSRVSANK